MAVKTLYMFGFVGLTALSVQGQAALYAQCGGIGWTGATTCATGAVCTDINSYYYQCLPASSATSVGGGSPTTSTVSVSSPTSTCGATPPSSAGTLKYAGVNIAGFDFGCDTSGDCTASGAYPPLAQYYGADGIGQMTHFVNDDKFNIFRLPVGWQYLTNNVLTGTLDETNFAEYDTLVQGCLGTGASCIVDIHNYARWNGQIIGQGGPSNEIFASLWSSIATKYASQPKVIFGIMNEPHDLPSIPLWAGTVQAAVTAIRQAGATSQLVLLPGDNWTSAATFVSGGSADALNNVTNPDGSTTGLIMDVHKYLDSDNSGTNAECVTDNIASAWQPLSQWLRCNGRQALNTETGGGNVASCETYMCQQIDYQAQNSDVILGYVGWAAGNFAASYVLGETPTQSGTTWTDTALVSTCMAPSANGVAA
ncbi:glycoside hydrolase family 5 protein [Serpula lacrymans var. lacrymans S7.3]|uniref:cellulase n=2 Tax=Serpula lacrymans var. lacrymans TaxID=341189 RepID=F8Q2E5_SERL3|nr:glycoside hydrolase family 5 protein, cellulose binding module 1 [Serpula lacrymans var. lacrymans S7.9]EGN97356.1 glycoside hydrolase family 5 protein [Serpula lacrymans var. lacrymans S7.3]EGO23340.1 glycoside hydrolase family 5 protein, cellulose binding module 1 [Serpula lacrymans var. lacrymans S7.9]